MILNHAPGWSGYCPWERSCKSACRWSSRSSPASFRSQVRTQQREAGNMNTGTKVLVGLTAGAFLTGAAAAIGVAVLGNRALRRWEHRRSDDLRGKTPPMTGRHPGLGPALAPGLAPPRVN